MFHATITQLLRPLLIALTITAPFTACKPGETGPAGPAGPAGATGNANVIQISYGSRTHTGAELSYSLTGMTTAQVNGAAFFTYVNPGNNFWYSLPGTTAGGAKEYRTYTTANAGSTPFAYISRVAGTGSETFTATRIIIVPANELKSGRKAAVDYANYAAVKAYYNLPD